MSIPPAMDAQESVIGEVIAQFYSFFGSLMSVRDTVASARGLGPADRNYVLEQLAQLESELYSTLHLCSFLCDNWWDFDFKYLAVITHHLEVLFDT